MSKQKKERLFHLVQSLSRHEKRYFKLYCKHAGRDTLYIKLFDIICKQKSYDEEKAKQKLYSKLEDKKDRKFPDHKHYLHEILLDALVEYHEKNTIEFRIKEKLKRVHLLFRRSLHYEAKIMLNRVKKLATRHEHYTALIEIADWERRIANANFDLEYMNTYQDRLAESKEYLEQIQYKNEYWNLLFQVYLISYGGGLLNVRDEERNKMDEELTKNLLLTNPPKNLSTDSSLLKGLIACFRLYNKGLYSDLYTEGSQLLNLIRPKLELFADNPTFYDTILNLMGVCCTLLYKYNEADRYLQELTVTPYLSEKSRTNKINLSYQNRLVLLLEKGEFKTAKELISEADAKYNITKQPIVAANFFYQYFYLLFGMEDYEEALYWLNQLLYNHSDKMREDTQSVARIANLIIHYELNHNEFIDDYVLRSTYRYLLKKNSLLPFERLIIANMRNIIYAHSRNDLLRAFKHLRRELREHVESSSDYGFLSLFDFISWLDSKILNKPFHLVVKETFSLSEKAGKRIIPILQQ